MALDFPASSSSAGSGLGGRALTASEERAFRRRRLQTRVALAALVLAVPALAVFSIAALMKPSAVTRTRSYANGTPEVVAEYVGGKKSGAFTQYYSNGKMKAAGFYADDV